MDIIFIRHGKTQGNIDHKYIGKTDEELSEEGIFEITKNIKSEKYPDLSEKKGLVISSPMKRCVGTAEIIYNKIDIIENDLRECDFGDFENKNYEQLKKNKFYIEWISSGGQALIPNGENKEDFCRRCQNAFYNIIIKNKSFEYIVFVVHGGTIMAILEKYFYQKRNFYYFQIENSEILVFEALINSDNQIKIIDKLG